MILKRQFIIISGIIIALALSIGFFIFLQTQKLEGEVKRNRVASGIMKGVFELDILLSDYLRYPGERIQNQWQSRYQSIDKLLHLDMSPSLEERAILNDLHKDHDNIQSSFSQLEENMKMRGEELYSQELEERMVAELLVRSRTMVANASRLIEITHAELFDLQRRIAILVMTAIGILMAVIILTLLMLNRVILRPILKLREGAEIIGEGNLKYRIAVEHKDEIGALAVSFNHMSGKLKSYYTGLENKVKERTRELEHAKKGAEQKARRLEEMKTATLNILEDVKEAEDQIKEEKIFSESILKAMPDGLSIIDEDYNLVFMNKTFLDKFGKKSIGKKCYEIYKDDKKRCADRSVTKDLKIGETKVMEISDMAGGRTFLVAHTGIFLNGKKHILEIFKDITERKEIDRAKNEFVSLASHQLRTPLTGIKWLIQAVLKRGSLNKWQIEFLEDAIKSNDRMILLVNDLLNISRLEAGVIGVLPKKTDLSKLIEEMIRDAKISSTKRRQKIQFKKPKQKIIFSLDQQLVGQVITNLLSNAIKYSGDDKTITVSVAKRAKEVDIIVQDQGIGLSKEDQEKVFTKFFRSQEAAKISTTGSGLGLYIVKKVLDACNGKIKCSSVKGKGSTFTVTLPLKGPLGKRGQKELITHRIS